MPSRKPLRLSILAVTMMTALFAVSCRSSRSAVRVSSSVQATERTADTLSAAAAAVSSARVTVGGAVADTLELLLTRPMADSLPLGASWVSARGALTLTVEKTPKGLLVTSRSPRTCDVSAEVSTSSSHSSSAAIESDRKVEESAGALAAQKTSPPKGYGWLPVVIGAALLVYLGWITRGRQPPSS